jgi:hypothetical protein
MECVWIANGFQMDCKGMANGLQIHCEWSVKMEACLVASVGFCRSLHLCWSRRRLVKVKSDTGVGRKVSARECAQVLDGAGASVCLHAT